MKRVLSSILACATVLGLSATASASSIKGQPYTFTGSVASATAGCPYKAKASLAGYTLVNTNTYYNPNGTVEQVIQGPVLMISPGGTASKETLKIGDIPNRTGSSSGALTVVSLPSTGVVTGTYKAALAVGANGAFTLKLSLAYKSATGTCSTVYTMAFAKGLPNNLFNLL